MRKLDFLGNDYDDRLITKLPVLSENRVQAVRLLRSNFYRSIDSKCFIALVIDVRVRMMYKTMPMPNTESCKPRCSKPKALIASIEGKKWRASPITTTKNAVTIKAMNGFANLYAVLKYPQTKIELYSANIRRTKPRYAGLAFISALLLYTAESLKTVILRSVAAMFTAKLKSSMKIQKMYLALTTSRLEIGSSAVYKMSLASRAYWNDRNRPRHTKNVPTRIGYPGQKVKNPAKINMNDSGDADSLISFIRSFFIFLHSFQV